MASWLLAFVIVNIVQFGLSINSLSYHPDYSKLTASNLVIILGALIDLLITLLVIIILYIMRPIVSIKEEEKQILQISSEKKLLDKLLVKKAEESRKSWQFYPIQISAASTDSKTGEEPTLTRIYDINDYFKALPKLPSSMNEIEGGQPVVFHFMEKKPEIAILPVYIIKKDEKEPITRETFLKSSGSERKHLERSLSKATTEIQTARDLSIKKGSVTTTPPSSVLSTPSAHKKIDAGKVAKSDSSAKKKSKSKRVTAPVSLTKSVDEGKLLTKLPPAQSSPSSSPSSSTLQPLPQLSLTLSSERSAE